MRPRTRTRALNVATRQGKRTHDYKAVAAVLDIVVYRHFDVR